MRALPSALLLILCAAACGSVKSENLDATGDDDGGPVIDADPGDGGGGDDAPGPDAAVASCTPVQGTTVALAPYVTGTDQPLMITGPSGDTRQFVIEQDGRIRVIKDGLLVATPFLDLTTLVLAGGERGLLGIAFHPSFATNNKFYVHYSARPNGDHVIAEFTATAGTDTATLASRRNVLQFADPFSNHNGGMIEFGNDGKLYIAIGDGGSGGDPADRAQNDAVLFGKILRIDVDTRTGTKQYGIPTDNPFASSPDGAADPRPEVWHKGLRNPFRFSFDRANGNIYIGDVGQEIWEEIDVVGQHPAGQLGLGRSRGPALLRAGDGLSDRRTAASRWSSTTRATGWDSIMGGQVYRGTCYPDLVGTYFYGDYSRGQLWAFEYNGSTAINNRMVLNNVGNITAIHADGQGELYLVTHNGVIRKIIAQ